MCTAHSKKMHERIELIAGKLSGLTSKMKCKTVNDIIEDIVCRSLGHEIGHNAEPCAPAGSQDLICKKCGSSLTIETEDAYREIAMKFTLHEKQNPRSL